MEEYQIHRNIICIDLKSFYASVECVLRDLDPFETPLVVADPTRGGGSVVLSVTPYLKKRGIPNVLRVFELPTDIEIIKASPRMQEYLNYSSKVIEVYLEFISEDDLYVYSVDEAFLDVTNYLEYYKMNDVELAKAILSRIHTKLKLYATAGIGPNMLLAKLSMDIEAKKNSDNIAKWGYSDVPNKLWPVTPLSKMWGIGARMERHLNLLGLYTIGDIANYDKDKLKKRFGILGEELYFHTHGIDMSLISDKLKVKKPRKSFGMSQVMFRDYYGFEIILIIKEVVDEVTRRLRTADVRSGTISLGVMYSKNTGGGFGRQVKLEQPTNNETIIYEACLEMFNKYYDDESPIRRISVAASSLTTSKTYQYSIFEDANMLDKEYKLQLTIDSIKNRYGKNSITRASAELDHSTIKKRNKFIGGHHE